MPLLDALLENRLPALGSPVGPSLASTTRCWRLSINLPNRPDGSVDCWALPGGRRPDRRPPLQFQRSPRQRANRGATLWRLAAADRQAIESRWLFSLTALNRVTVAASPKWLQQRLEHAGLRADQQRVSMSPNLVMLETGQTPPRL